MDGKPKGMAQKRQRHYNETNSVIAVAMILFGICSAFCLIFIYPQIYSVSVFNSRLAYNLILDIEDYFTCNPGYVGFVIDEPDASFAMFTVFVFNVTNTDLALLRGFKPRMLETGPYGFVKNTYKYDIYFDDPETSEYVTFKEYSLVEELKDESLCEKMYFRMDRDLLEDAPCANGACKCQPYDSVVTIVNPSFLRALWEDTPSTMMAHFAVDVFDNIKQLLEEPFTEAVQAHLVSESLKETFLFRVQMQVGPIFVTALDTLVNELNYTVNQVFDTNIPVNLDCGLSIYNINGCPFRLKPPLDQAKNRKDINETDYPSVLPLFNTSAPHSIFNLEKGLPKWVGLSWYFGNIEFNSVAGYTAVSDAEFESYYYDFSNVLAVAEFGADYTADQFLGAQRIVRAVTFFIADSFLEPFSVFDEKLQDLAYAEFLDTSEPVPCAPTTAQCVWQWGYMRDVLGAPFDVSTALAESFIDSTREVSTNPNSFFKDINGPLFYNSFKYCTEVLPNLNNSAFDISCTNLGFTIEDGVLTRPAGIWGIDNGVSPINLTFLHTQFLKQSAAVQEQYLYLGCNVSFLMHSVYRNATDYHNDYVIRYLNKFKDPLFSHNFTVGNWSELGVAQFGGGFVTDALAKVRSIHQLTRDGMWRIGADNYYEKLSEFSSWAVTQGYPHAWIYNIDDSRLLLHSLARRDSVGTELRQHISRVGTTFIGDGVNFENSVGDVGDVTFTREANRGNFSCSDSSSENAAVCRLLDVFFDSSADECSFIQDLFDTCQNEYTFANNKWIDIANCATFETTKTSPSLGIQCDDDFIFGKEHSYRKSRGNIVFLMMFSLTVQLELSEGLWCSTSDGCDFSWGGMFTTTTVRKLLFNGYTEPSLMKYLNRKHENDDISFECEVDAFDQCGVQTHQCNGNGLLMRLPGYSSSSDSDSSSSNNYYKLFKYGTTSNDEFFAPSFFVKPTGEMLWPFSSDNRVANYAREQLQLAYETSSSSNSSDGISGSNDGLLSEGTKPMTIFSGRTGNITEVRNPHWAAYPAWNTLDVDFNKYYQCQKRTYMGYPDLFDSCVDRLQTGRLEVRDALKLVRLHGNDSVFHFEEETGSLPTRGSTVNNQYQAYLWNGFEKYPYNYLGREDGDDYKTLKRPLLYSKMHALQFKLSQQSLIFQFQRELNLQMPISTTADTVASTDEFPATNKIPVRRFVEDEDTWQQYRDLGTPRDFFGMRYEIPIGFASLERLSSFPVFVETPHSYGNEKWGGLAFTFVSGTERRGEAQRTFVDYDPVTGQAIRSALRQQLSVRVEANPLFPNVFSSQQRCVLPTKAFALGSGYGCFAYVPIFWFEDARVTDSETFYRYYDHYYSRPDRAEALTTAGITMGCFLVLVGSCWFINEAYHRRRFQRRVYVD